MSLSIELTLEEVEKYLKESYDEEKVLELVEDVIPDYLDQDWEEDFEDEHEAYQEQGRGEAESHVRTDIENDIFKKFYSDFPFSTNEQRTLVYSMYKSSTGEELWETINRIFDCLDR